MLTRVKPCAKRTWFQRPLTALCVLAGITVFSAYVIFSSDGRRETGEEIGFAVTLRHYGRDAREMETTAAIPLEDALAAIPGISRLVTTSENGRVRTYVNFRVNRGLRRGRGGFFAGKEDYDDDYYEAVREAAQRVYETLPSSAQRPELSSSSDVRIPFWTAAVYGAAGNSGVVDAPPDGAILERVVKPALSAIEGVGEVEIAGPGIREIIITLDQEKAAAMNIEPGKLAAVLASNDAVFSGGFLNYGTLEIPVRIDGRYPDPESLGEALIPIGSGHAPPGRVVRLNDIADIRERDREEDTLSRLNGKKTSIVSVTAASGADHRILSKRIKNEVEKLSSFPLEWKILEDRGAEEARAFRSVLIAALESSALVALAVVFLGTGKSSPLAGALICAGAVPLISVMSAAVLASAGFPVNRKFLAGLAAGIGCAVDAVILSADGFGQVKENDPSAGGKVLSAVWRPLISGAATTVAALLPLTGFSSAEDNAVIPGALGTVTLVSVALALTLLPPLFLWGNSSRNLKKISFVPVASRGTIPLRKIWALFTTTRRKFFRFFAALVNFCWQRPFVFPLVSFLISAAAILALAVSDVDTAGEWAEDSVYFQVEFEGGFLKEEADPLLAAWSAEIKNHPAVRDVQAVTQTGSASGLVTFDPRESRTDEIRAFIRSKNIPGAFIFIPEASPSDRIWTITVSGDESEKCRELAREAASRLTDDSGAGLSFVKETVLNFKRGGPRLTLFPRRELLGLGGIAFSSAADTVRRGLHGPVAYKRNSGGETDVRIKFSAGDGSDDTLTGDDVLRIPLTATEYAESPRVASIMEAVKTEDFSGIRRENRRRTASFSIRTDPGDPRFFRDKVMELLAGVELPSGYKIEFDPEAVRKAEALSREFFGFVWAVLFCYMIIAAAEESFTLPLVVLSSVPSSLAVPVLLFTVFSFPLNTASACALVAVSGMTVNASVISAGELRRRGTGSATSVYRALRGRIPVLTATTVTTIAGALPFLFLRGGNNLFIRTFALVTVIGVAVSFFCSITLVPSLMKKH